MDGKNLGRGQNGCVITTRESARRSEGGGGGAPVNVRATWRVPRVLAEDNGPELSERWELEIEQNIHQSHPSFYVWRMRGAGLGANDWQQHRKKRQRAPVSV